MHARYMPWYRAADGTWALLDWEQMEFCSLRDNSGRVLPLTWKSKNSAEAWLQKCYVMWALWEKDGGGTPPRDWRPRPAGPSPYSLGTM